MIILMDVHWNFHHGWVSRPRTMKYGINNKLNYGLNASISVHCTFYLLFYFGNFLHFGTIFYSKKKASLAYCNQLYFNVKKTKKILLQSLRSQLCPDNESSFQYGFNIQGVSLKLFKKVASLKLHMPFWQPKLIFFSFCKDW